jgi:hypothetical protein
MLWPLTLTPEIFGGESIGVAFLIFLPMLIFSRKVTRFEAYGLIIAGALYTAWFIVYQYTRFFFPTLIFLSILTAFSYDELCAQDPWVRRLTSFLILLVFCYGAVLSVYHNLDKCKVAFGLETKENYLLKNERSYGIAQYVNHHVPKNAKILSLTEPRLFYFERDIAVVSYLRLDFEAKRGFFSGPEFDQFLKETGYGDYMVWLRDYSKEESLEASLAPVNFFTGYKKTLLTRSEFQSRSERYIYEVWKIGELIT